MLRRMDIDIWLTITNALAWMSVARSQLLQPLSLYGMIL